MDLSTNWPVLMEEGKWNESLWKLPKFFDYSYLVDLSLTPDLKNTSRRALYVRSLFYKWLITDSFYKSKLQIGAAKLGLPRDVLLQGLEDKNLKTYHRRMVNVSTLFGANQSAAERDHLQVLQFEMQLANVSNKIVKNGVGLSGNSILDHNFQRTTAQF